MFAAWPSDVPPARETIPNGNFASVPEEADHTSRQVSTRFRILQA